MQAVPTACSHSALIAYRLPPIVPKLEQESLRIACVRGILARTAIRQALEELAAGKRCKPSPERMSVPLVPRGTSRRRWCRVQSLLSRDGDGLADRLVYRGSDPIPHHDRPQLARRGQAKNGARSCVRRTQPMHLGSVPRALTLRPRRDAVTILVRFSHHST